MKKIGLIVFAAFLGGAVAIGAYKLLERNNDSFSLAEKQNMIFANNPIKVSSTGAVDFVQAAAAVSPAVVHIKTTYGTNPSNETRQGGGLEDFFDFFGGGGSRRGMMPRAASGSGVILTADGYIVTNNHVVDKADKIEVILSNRRKVTAKVIGKDPNTDLALIKVDVDGLPFVKMGNSDNVQIGEWVLAVGFPLDLQTTVTAGIVSAKARSIGILDRESNGITREEYMEMQRTGVRPERPASTAIESFIQTDAAINPGNSGGALVNANGELIGINSAIASQTGRNEGYGFAIPVNLAKKILEDFKQFGSVKRGYIGVSFKALDADVAEYLKIKDINGLYVSDVLPGGAAAVAGIKEGDIIKKVEGVEIYDSPDLQEKIGRLRPGDKVSLGVLKADGSLKNIVVTLKPESSMNLASAKKTEAVPTGTTVAKLGASFAPASTAVKAKYKATSGVVVTNVEPGKLFDYFEVTKGLLITTVNGKPVNSSADVEKALATSGNGKTTIAGFGENGAYTFSFN
ncbi:trypsin-like peptidase domain-containing protein [Pedobacter insulae]|uniref:Serine protease, S1-C subfamily, contains C-terminal PDZ domain n=1 Tax=Pedobacter insulae TaxID=414048 RepID=A0A1I2YWC2_9SPHI|nr:trypsin-like peptidase domain-containing protein [Pedobacter insulae]SFH29569.1 serine protease, S1-C subfamily, contains C-terminal PDZ domain [Pedobacter insulae]